MFLEKFPYNTKIISDNFPESIPSFIEVSQSSRMKYEWSHKKKSLELDRVLHSAVFYPHNYGFIPQTLCDDGDPLDVLVICDGPLIPGCFVQVRPICYMVMEDEKGNDEKLLAVAEKDPHYSHIKTIDDIPSHTLKEISQFFETYKTLEKEKWVKIGGWKDKNEAFKLIKSTHQKYKKEKNLSTDSLKSLDVEN
jgi:inorganic pyrophosphatase|tara:strand:- start:361 stop:942 length:582 start_codon:yes stop_codon:yes gene_type:complete